LTVRQADALGLNEIYLAVHNASDHEREITVELLLDGMLVDVVDATVAAHTTVERLSRLPLPPGDVMEARLDVEGENVLTSDDVAFAVLKPGARVQTLLLTEHPTTFVAEALMLHPRVDLSTASPEALPAVTGTFDLIVIDTGYEGPLPEAEHLIVLDAGAQRLGLQTDGSVTNPDIIRWSFDHSLFRFVNLDDIHIAGATATVLPEGAVALVDMADGPLVFELEHEGRDVIVFTFHPDSSDLVLRVAFVNMMANLVEWAQPPSLGHLAANVGIGERLGEEGSDLSVVAIAGPAPSLLPGFRADQPIPAAGVYRLETSDGITRGLVSANLFSVAEAEVEPVTRLGVGAAYGWPEVFRTEEFPWWMLVAAAIGLIALEWLLPLLMTLAFTISRRRRPRAERRESKSRLARVEAE
jgi:hypothetical protein